MWIAGFFWTRGREIFFSKAIASLCVGRRNSRRGAVGRQGFVMTLEEYQAQVAREKRAALLEAALVQFTEDGYSRASLDRIAKRAGISSATLYKHFQTKDQLFGAVTEKIWAEGASLDLPAPAIGDARAGLLQLAREYAAFLRRPLIVPFFRMIIAEVERAPELGQELYLRGKKPWLDRVTAYLAAEHEVGHLHVPDTAMAARQLAGMINDMVFWPRFLVKDLIVTDEDAERVAVEAVATLIARHAPM
ncbi:MAG: TetR family transcriptional regulator [Methylobacterium sp.]|nr:MAG: TetR family transcriptional regulator [Methylobacterium sp.]